MCKDEVHHVKVRLTLRYKGFYIVYSSPYIQLLGLGLQDNTEMGSTCE
jgi:hypothetical protein